MAQILYDANGNPIIDPYQSQQAKRLPPDVPQGDMQVNPGNRNVAQQLTPQQQTGGGTQSGGSGAAGGIADAGSGIVSAIKMLMQRYGQNQQQGPAGQLNPDTQVGPATPAPDAATGVNVNQVANPAAAGTGPTAQQRNAASALISQAGQTGQALQNYAANASWRDIASAIPSPDQFMQQEQQQEQQYDFTRNPIV